LHSYPPHAKVTETAVYIYPFHVVIIRDRGCMITWYSHHPILLLILTAYVVFNSILIHFRIDEGIMIMLFELWSIKV